MGAEKVKSPAGSLSDNQLGLKKSKSSLPVLNAIMARFVESMTFSVSIPALSIIRGKISTKMPALFSSTAFSYGMELPDVPRLYLSTSSAVARSQISKTLINKLNDDGRLMKLIILNNAFNQGFPQQWY